MKYKICKLENSLGGIWYQIRKKGWIFDSWLIKRAFTNRGSPYNKLETFSSEDEARKYLQYYLLLQKKTKVTELP
jgi:hypothetical protein